MNRRHFMSLVGASCALSATSPATAYACLWDNDTLSQEARGAPEVVPTLVGAFARNPPRYYEMRLARVDAEIHQRVDDLALYDDAAVACDRLGRADEAIAWMAHKRAVLERLGVFRESASRGSPNHWYRYHANLGTFYAHRWLRREDPWSETTDLHRAHELIAAAIEDNPDAHFGREVYQLRILDWLRGRPQLPQEGGLPCFIEEVDELRSDRTFGPTGVMRERGLADAIPGLCGLITLGAAWSSFDVTRALAELLMIDGSHSLAELAVRRCEEIVEAGGGSLVIGAPTGATLLRSLPYPRVAHGARLDYDELRVRAHAWSRRREAYLLERLERGEHPDTHEYFWADFEGDPTRMSAVELGLEAATPKWSCSCEASGADSGATKDLGLGLAGLGVLTMVRGRMARTSG